MRAAADGQEGTLEIAVSDKSVELSTTWQNLHIPHSHSTSTLLCPRARWLTAGDEDGQDAEERPPPNHFFSANVGIKALLKFLGSYLVGGTAIACESRRLSLSDRLTVGICSDYCVIAYVYVGVCLVRQRG